MPARGRFLTGLVLALLLSGCVPADGPQSQRRSLLVFGTIVDVEVVADTELATRALGEVETYFARVNVDWHAFGDGELGLANEQLARGTTAEVSPELAKLIERALELRTASDGFFDPALAALVEQWGFDDFNKEARPPPPNYIKEWRAGTAARASLRVDGARIRADGPVRIDLGGIAKGAALEGAAERLEQLGIESAIVDAGGDIKVLGSRGEREWIVGIRHPRADRVLARVVMQPGEAIVSSGDYARYFESQGRRLHHVLDPRSGLPVAHTIAVTVLAPDATLADAAATALMAGGPDQFEALCDSLGIAAALLIRPDGELLATTAMRARLQPPDGPIEQAGRFSPQL